MYQLYFSNPRKESDMNERLNWTELNPRKSLKVIDLKKKKNSFQLFIDKNKGVNIDFSWSSYTILITMLYY